MLISTPLSDRIRADMFTHLSAMEKAGISPEQSFSLLRLPDQVQPCVTTMQKMLSKGMDVPTAGLASGLFTALETTILRTAFNAGSPEISYQRLATRYNHLARQSSLITSRMMMPLFILFIALLVQPLPALMTGAISVGNYLLFVLRPFIVLAALVYLYRFISSRLRKITPDPTSIQISLSVLLTHIPLFGTMLVRRNVRDFYENLALMLEAGIPLFDALPKAVDTVSLCVIRADFCRLLPQLKQGMTLAQAVASLHYQSKYPVQSFVQTGEGSGNLPEMLLRFADAESEAVAQFQSEVALWSPRLFYGVIVAWMAYQLLHQRII